ncbi:MAG: glycosyltransferase family 39 protein [Thermoflexales bacterium]|nr:glycosyltransferase family 39 protein [Thermoflexales bacterium]
MSAKRWALVGVALLAFGVRVLSLDAQSLWFDEGWSWHLARMPLVQMALTTAADRSPPLYYALLAAWIALGGDSAFAMRFLSAAADVSATALTSALALALTRSRHVATAASAVYALTPMTVWYAQEVRMYALVSALGAAAMIAAWRWVEQRRKLWLLLANLFVALATYMHYYAIFLLPALWGLALLASLHDRPSTWRALPLVRQSFATGAILLTLAPWLAIASVGFAYDDGFHFPLNTVEGRLLEWARAVAAGGLVEPPHGWALLLGGTALLGVLGFVTRRQHLELIAVLTLIVLPLLAATLAVRLFYPHRSVFHPRYLIFVLPALCVLLGSAWAISQRWTRAFAAAAATALLSALWLPTLLGYLSGHTLQRDNVRQATHHVVEALQPGDLVIMSRDNFAVRYYWQRTVRAIFGEAAPAWTSALVALPHGLHGVLHDESTVLTQLNRWQPQRVRLMLWQDDVVDPQRLIESTLWANGFELGEYNFAQIRLPLYRIERRPLVSIPFAQRKARFGECLALERAWMRPRAVVGDWFYVVLEWSLSCTPQLDYKVFVHARDAAGMVHFQSDRLPLNALLPMQRWELRQAYRDAHAMVVPIETPPGRYAVFIGAYDPHSGQRLTSANGSDSLLVGSVEVIER